MMRRILAFVLSVLMLIGAASCSPSGSKDPANDTSDNTEPDQTPNDENKDPSDTDTPDQTPDDESKEPEGPTEREIDERYFVFRMWNFNITPMSTFKNMVNSAKETGFNAIKIHVPWLHAQQFPNKCDFSAFDQMIDYAIEQGMKVAISLDMTRKANDKALIPEEHLQKDAAGNVCQGGVYYDKSVISFSSEYATTLATNFYEKAIKHFEEKYSENILFYLPAFTPYCETEYWCVGDYDYSTSAVEAFREFLSEKYGVIQLFNDVTGESFNSFDAIVPPSSSRVDAFGMLWYQFRHTELKNFIDQLEAAQKKVAPDSKFAIQFGSVFDNSSTLRGTLGFVELCENADVVWIDDGPTYNHEFSMDYIRSVLPASVELAQEIDGPLQHGASPENYRAQGMTSFEREATYVSIANWSIDENYRSYEHVWKEIVSTWLSDNPPATLKVTKDSPTIEVKLSKFFTSGTLSGYISRHTALSAGNTAVYIKVIDDLTSREINGEESTDDIPINMPFYTEQGKDGWYYMSHKNGTFTPMTYDEANGRWQGESEFTLVMPSSVHPGDHDVALVYETRQPGTLVYEALITVISEQSNGVKYTLYVNGKKVTSSGCEGVADAFSPASISTEINLKKGDRVALVINNNGASSFDTTALSINVSYK